MSSTGVGDSIEPEGRMVIPAHMLHVVSLASMETLLSDTEVEQKSPSSESETSIDSPAPSELGCRDSDSGAASVERDGEFHPGSRLDATDSDATQKASVNELPEKIPPSSLSQITDLYRKWKRLSWPMALCIILGLIILIWGHGHLLQLLQWLENLPLHESLLVFICLFSLVSLPFGFGYIILNVMAGYIYGIVNGQLIVMVSVAVGISNSFLLCRKWFRDYVKTMVTSNALQAMLRVVEGPNGFKVIVLTRFTPIPFGIQNVLFSMTGVSFWQFLIASMVGLLPTQVLNTYMGSTVRNMQEVLADRVDGYIILGIQAIFSIILMLYLLNKARRELAKLTNTDVECGNPDSNNI